MHMARHMARPKRVVVSHRWHWMARVYPWIPRIAVMTRSQETTRAARKMRPRRNARGGRWRAFRQAQSIRSQGALEICLIWSVGIIHGNNSFRNSEKWIHVHQKVTTICFSKFSFQKKRGVALDSLTVQEFAGRRFLIFFIFHVQLLGMKSACETVKPVVSEVVKTMDVAVSMRWLPWMATPNHQVSAALRRSRSRSRRKSRSPSLDWWGSQWNSLQLQHCRR